MHFPLPVQSERETALEQARQLLELTPTDVLIAYLPVLARRARPPRQVPERPLLHLVPGEALPPVHSSCAQP